jgi:hypothetical protein
MVTVVFNPKEYCTLSGHVRAPELPVAGAGYTTDAVPVKLMPSFRLFPVASELFRGACYCSQVPSA